MAKNKCTEVEARKLARENLFNRVVIFGLGTTGMFIGDLIRQKYPNGKILFVGRSDESSSKVIFAKEQAKAEYLQSNFNTNEELAAAITNKLGGKATTFIGVSGSNIEHEIAFTYGVLGCNGIYNSFSLGPKINFDTMPFGFKNHLIFGSINFRQDHMEEAIKILEKSPYDKIVELIDKEEFIKDPMDAYKNKIYAKGSPLKTAVVWNSDYVDFHR